MIRKTLQTYLAVMRPHQKLWASALMLSIIFFIGMNIALPWLLSRFIGELTTIGGKTMGDLLPFLWWWVMVRIIIFGVGRIQINIHFRAILRTLRDIDLKSFQLTLGHSNEFFANNFTGSIVTKFNRFSRSFETIASAVMFDVAALIVQFVFPFFILLFIAPVIGVVLLLWTIVFTIILIWLHKKKIPLSREAAAYDSQVTGVVADTVTNALSVKMFSRFTSEYASFEALSQKRLSVRFRNLLFGDYIRMYKTTAMIVLEVFVFYFSIRFAINGTIAVSQVLLIQLYIQQLTVSLWNFGKLVEKIEEALADATEMTEIYLLEPSVKDPVSPKKFIDVRGEINFKDVVFRYEGERQQPVFNKLTLSIPVGQKVGFVGPSGGGKTTLTKLLLRLMDVESGEITIDGQNIARVAQDDLRQTIAYVPQEPLLFHRSIYENIRYGDPKATKAEVLEAARLAHADEFIAKLPNGYETLVGERGVKLSGGQKQRVAIARAMLKKSPILMLDEATSALDSKSEKLITSALGVLMQNRTTIVIAHRLSTIRKLDRIIVLTEKGVVEDGRHKQLLAKKGVYSDLWHHQHDDFL